MKVWVRDAENDDPVHKLDRTLTSVGSHGLIKAPLANMAVAETPSRATLSS
jgi:hypothetical protein